MSSEIEWNVSIGGMLIFATIAFVLFIFSAIAYFLLNNNLKVRFFRKKISLSGLIFIIPISYIVYWFFGLPTGRIRNQGPNRIYDSIEFSGQLKDKLTNKPLNNRLIIAYINGEEVSRSTTHQDNIEISNLGIVDGWYSIKVPNVYEVPIKSINIEADGAEIKDSLASRSFSSDLPLICNNLNEGEFIKMNIKHKAVECVVKVIPGDYNFLPDELRDDSKKTYLVDNKIMLNSSKGTNSLKSYGIKNVVYDTVQSINILRTIDVPFNNCGGSGEITQKYHYSQVYIHEVKFDADAKIEASTIIPLNIFAIKLSGNLQAHYGFKEGQTSEESIDYSFTSPPRKNQVYNITWKEVWNKGTAVVQLVDGTDIKVPFKVKTKVTYEVNSTQNKCQ